MGGFCHSLCPLQPEVRGRVEKKVLSPKWTGSCESGSEVRGPAMRASGSHPELGPGALEQPRNQCSSAGGCLNLPWALGMMDVGLMTI